MGADFDAGGIRVAMSDNGEVRYFVTDHLGSTTKMINADGTTFPNGTNFEIKYYSWGADQPDIPDLGTSFKYTGQRQAEAGLYFYNARWYDPKIGRFIQSDTDVPESQGSTLGFDRYAYVGNNPISHTDSSGHCWGIASSIRGIPTYASTCSNLDSALSIVTNSNTTFGQRLIASSYIWGETLAHVGLVIAAGMAACSTIAACTAAAGTYLGIGTRACEDGDCTNEAVGVYQTTESIINIEKSAEDISNDILYYFSTPDLLTSHFGEHGELLGFSSEEAYLQGANNLFAGGSGVETIKRSYDNATLFWRGSTNEFGVLASDGTIQTYFIPYDGLDYWLDQLAKWKK